MATGRTHLKHVRVYADGYNLSGYTRQIGPLEIEFDTDAMAALTDEVKNVLPGHAQIGVGELNGFFDNTATSGLHVVANGAGVKRTVLVAIGIRAAPAQGDPAFMGEFEQLGYNAVPDDGFVVASLPFGKADAVAAHLAYVQSWGVLLAPLAARTAVNSSAGVDLAASTALGGYMEYQVTAGNGTATIKVQDSADNSAFADVSGLTSGSIDCSTPKHGIVALARSATIRQYCRYQIVFGTATSVTFALALVKATL